MSLREAPGRAKWTGMGAEIGAGIGMAIETAIGRGRLLAAGMAMIGWLVSGCATVRRPTVPPEELAKRLVLALDGVDYRDMVAARERGLFAAFRPPSRLISTFPSISDIAWHDIFGVVAPKGYQRIYYSRGQNTIVGGALDAIRTIEYEDRMDMAFGAKFHHLSAYIASNAVARNEINAATRDFFRIRGRSTVYVYNLGPDALQHTRGDLEQYLAQLDDRLTWLREEYRSRTGRDLEIVVLSDHGHNRARHAKFLPVVATLEQHGFNASRQLRTATDVAFSVDGVTTGFGVFVLPDSIPSVVSILAATEGVDVVTTRVDDSTFLVQAGALQARIDRRGAPHDERAPERYRYVPLKGDPLMYDATLKRMGSDRALDDDGFAEARAWVRYTAEARYPAALMRIARGHTTVTLNPAPILVSLSDDFRVGLGMVGIANRMRPLGGSHGALINTNAVGIVMTTHVDTHDDVTAFVRDQLGGFHDLGPVLIKRAGARLTSFWTIERDTRSPFTFNRYADAVGDTVGYAAGGRWPDIASAPFAGSRPAIDVWLTANDVRDAGEAGALMVEVRSARSGGKEAKLIATSYLPLPDSATVTGRTDLKAGWIPSADRQHYVLALQESLTAALVADTPYEFRIVLDHRRARRGRRDVSSREIATFTVRTNARGELWPY